MNDIAIQFENISKQYRLGTIGTGTISHDLNRWWHRVRGNEDPYAKIGETNDRTMKGESPYVWALKDISLDVKQGEVLGIIGKNGAGKSTLLKILSRVTAPTTGTIKAKGRIASLLEVGTGFHPEMTGRENIFMNGAIMGMNRAEIRRKLDAIIDFAGIAKYADTPVKRYSSGMTVRLGFAIAAHLEPEILVVDEVLAVGDAEFQKKAIGKMQDVSRGEGRTVLFVSHNMGAVKSLCNKGLLLEKGMYKSYGDVNTVVNQYFKNNDTQEGFFSSVKLDKSELVSIDSVRLKNQNNNYVETFNTGDDIIIELDLLSDVQVHKPNIAVGIKTRNGFVTVANTMFDGNQMPDLKKGMNHVTLRYKNIPLLPQEYLLGIGMRSQNCKEFLMLTKEIGYFAVTTRMSDLGIDSPMADEMAMDSVSPFIPYEWDFGNGNIQQFNILNNVKR